MKKSTILIAVILLSIFLPPMILADGGFWLPNQIAGKVYKDMKKKGLRLSEKEIYDLNQACLSNAILSLSFEDGTFSPYASASFISDEGLVLTNFHCIATYLEHVSDADHDYVQDGCWAQNRNQEMYLPNMQVNQLISIKDVTPEILTGTEGLSGEEFTRKMNENNKAIVKSEKGKGISAQVYSLFAGQQYVMVVFRSFKDVRIVAAPPINLGKFGGDTDNWQWPRYSADFAILRVYANDKNQPASYNKKNRPYHPDSHLKISTKGVKENDFVMVAGFPGQTRQYIPSTALEKIVFNDLQAEADVAKIKLDFYNQRKESCHDSLYSRYNVKSGSAANIYLKTIGKISGVRSSDLLLRKRAEEKELMDWILADEGRKQKYGENLLQEMEEVYNRLTVFNHTAQLFEDVALYGADIIPFAGKFEKLVQMDNRKSKSVTSAKKGEARRLKALSKQFYADYIIDDDKYLMKKLLAFYIERVDTAFFSDAMKKLVAIAPEKRDEYMESLYDNSPLRSIETMMSLLDSVPESNSSALSSDPLYQLSLGFYQQYVAKVNRLKQSYGRKNTELYSKFLQAYAEKNHGQAYAYDANKTPRISVGRVKGAVPMEGVYYYPFTTADGLVERGRMYAGNKDFSVSSRFADIVARRPDSRFFGKGEPPVCCFLADVHTTSGNSGSAVLNGRGEVVGINFDRIWQGVSSDFEKKTGEKSRNISVDIRYILWVLEQYSPSQYVLSELDLV